MTRPDAQRRNGSLRSRLFVGTALVAFVAAPHARADSAVGIATPLGTQLNPAGNSLYLPNDPMGMSQFFQNSRSPTGLLYPRPLLYPRMVQSQSNPDWWSSGWAEIGYLGTAGDTGAASFREYGDLSAGPVVNSAGFLAENRSSAFYLSGNMGSVGRSDQTYQLTLGRYGAFSATLFFDSIPHVFSTNAKILWDGAGTGNLTLPPGLTPGASTPSQVNSVLASLFPGEVSLTREKAGMAFTYTPHELSEVFFRFGYEDREGTRPLGATFGYPVFQNGVTELVEPIDYRTFDINAGARFKGETLQANLTYAGSFFRNDIPALTWDNPGLWNLPAGPYIPPQGQMALPPDNDYHTVKGDLAWVFTKGRFAASASYASMKQNAPLLPPTTGSGLINGVTGPIDLANWNTIGALSRDTALAEISTFNGFAQLQFNPTPQLRVDFEIRNRNEDNKTNYVALNPLTGQYGYIGLDGGLSSFVPILSGVYEPTVAGQRVQIRNIPFATDTLTLTAKAGYRLANRDRIELAYANKSIDYSNREIGDADDHRFSAQFVMRAREWGTTRVSYEFATVSGDTYGSNPYGPFNSTSLPGYIPNPSGDAAFTLGPLRKYDIADRTENALKTQTNFILSDSVDFQLGGNFRSYDYDADYGLKSARNYNLNAELTYQVSLATNFNVFYSFQGHKRDVASINRGGDGPDDSAGGPIYPLEAAWTEEVDDKNHVLGAGLRHQINSVTIDLNYTFTYGDSSLNYSYASPSAFFFDVTPEQAGSGFPENTFRHHLVQTSVLWKYTQNIGVRGYYRFEHEAIEDFHYAGLTQVIDNNIYLATIPESYTGHVFGIFFQYSY